MKQVAQFFFILVICEVFLIPIPAMAYLDPGSGSMLLQLLLGGTAGLILVIKLYWQSLVSFFKPKKEDESVSNNKEEK
jgi:hypothetical protein